MTLKMNRLSGDNPDDIDASEALDTQQAELRGSSLSCCRLTLGHEMREGREAESFTLTAQGMNGGALSGLDSQV